MDKRHRERGDNWTQEEKELLLELMHNSAQVIENKNTDTNANKLKKAEWLKLQQRFQELTGKCRDVTQLKGFWRRTKMTAKKNITQHKKALKMTGGGQKPPSPSDEDKKILEICPIDFVVEENLYDSDGVFQKVDLNIIQENAKVDIISDHGKSDNEDFGHDENISGIEEIVVADIHHKEVSVTSTPFTSQQMNSSMLKSPRKKLFFQKGRRLKFEKNHKAAILETNMELKAHTMKCFEEEHKLKIQYHKQELCHQALRHKLELDILLLEKEKKELEIKNIKTSCI